MTLHFRTGGAASNLASEDFLAAPQGEGSWAEGLALRADQFFREATSIPMLGGMAAGQIIFAPVRGALLNFLWNPGARSYLLGSLTSSFVASGTATAVEAPVFWGVSKAIEWKSDPKFHGLNNFTQSLQEVAGMSLMMGALRLTGFGAGALLQRAAKVPAESLLMPAASWLRSHPGWVYHGASVAGLYGIHRFQELQGWRPDHGAMDRWLDALVETAQFGVSGRLVERLISPAVQNVHRPLEEIQSNFDPYSWFSKYFSTGERSLAPEGLPLEEGRFYTVSKTPDNPTMNMSAQPSGSSDLFTAEHPAQKLIAKVLEVGRTSDINELKKIVLEACERLGFKPGERLRRYFTGADREEWITGIKILSLGGQETPLRLAQSLVEDPDFKEFSEKWHAQPHFRTPDDIPIKHQGGLPRGRTAAVKFFSRMQRILCDNPSLSQLKYYLNEGRGVFKSAQGKKKSSELKYQWEIAQSPTGRTLVIGRVDQLGIVLEFNESGFLAPPIYVSNLPEAEWVAGWFKKNLEAYRAGDVWEGAPLQAEMPVPRPDLISVEFFSNVYRTQRFVEVLKAVKGILSLHPDPSAVQLIAKRYTRRSHVEEAPEPIAFLENQTVYVYNRGQVHGLVLRFNSEGKLLLPIHVGPSLSPQWMEKIKASLTKGEWDLTPPVEEVSVAAPTLTLPVPPSPIPPSDKTVTRPSPIPVPSSFRLVPNAEQTPSTFAMDLVSMSRELDGNRQRDLSQALEHFLKSPDTKAFAMETMDRLFFVYKGQDPQSQAAVQTLNWEGLEQPLSQLSLPSVYFPERYGQYFAETLRGLLTKSERVYRMLEIGSGMGMLSLYLRKLKLVGDTVGFDLSENAASIAKANALINGVGRAEFFQGPDWKSIASNGGSDLLVTSMERLRRMSDSDGYELLQEILSHSRSRRLINKRGKVLIQGSSDSEALSIIQAFKKQGFTLGKYNPREGHQDPATRPFLIDAFPH